MNLAVEKINNPTFENPIEFTISARADGYLKTQMSYVIVDDSTLTSVVALVNLNEAPKGVSVAIDSAIIGSEGITEPKTIVAEATADKAEQLTVVIPVGTKMLDADGNELTGEASISVAHFGEQQDESIAAFPGGFEVTAPIDAETGQPMEDGGFTTAGFVEIDIQVGGSSVNSFSQPLDVTMEISPETLDPETGAPVQAGDVIPTWSLDDAGQWTMEGEATVYEENGKLKVDIPINHLSYWNLDYFWNSCYSDTKLDIVSAIQRNQNSPRLFIEIYNARTNRRMSVKYARLYNGEEITLLRAPRNTPLYLRVYERGNWWSRGNFLGQTATFNTCQRTSLDLTSITQGLNPLLIYSYITGICVEQNSFIRPYGYVYYRKSNDVYRNYRLLNIIRAGRSFTGELEVGETYDFYFRYGNLSSYTFENVTIQDQVVQFGEQQINIDIPEEGGRVFLYFNNIIIPDVYCDQIF